MYFIHYCDHIKNEITSNTEQLFILQKIQKLISANITINITCIRQIFKIVN